MEKHKFPPTKIIQRLFAGGSLTFSAIVFEFPTYQRFQIFEKKNGNPKEKKEQ